ncbi:endonuclease III [Methylocella sp.]|uniref:endonuclease III n=1 Tax=Methylocella sp. TaxID=1978226 RepID=UPI003783DE4C
MAKSPIVGTAGTGRPKTAKPRPEAGPGPKTAPAPAGSAPDDAPGRKPTARRAASKTADAAETARIEQIFARFQAASPHPEGELHYVNPYTLLVAVALSAQATDVGVNRATKPLFAIADTPQKMVALGEDRLREMIKTIGLYRTKAKHVIALSQRLIDDFGGRTPQDRAALETLPGVGRKTANVVLNIAFGAPLIAVDTHIFRVSNRVPIAPGKTPLAVELGLERVTPERYKLHAHHWLILHGRYVCKARRPECWRCLIEDLCRFPDKARPAAQKAARAQDGA